MLQLIKRSFIVFAMMIIFTAISVIAQDNPVEHTVSFDGVSLTYSTDFAEQVNITLYAGDPVESAGPGFSDAAHFTFQLYNEPFPALEGKNFPANIAVYRTADLAQYDFMQVVVDELQALINDNTDLSAYEQTNTALPHLPILTHGQVIRAQAHHVESETLDGIAYINAVQAAAEPFLQDSFWYTVQALSKDGEYYISANFALTAPMFPDEIGTGFDIEAFSRNLESYLAESIDLLNVAEFSDFEPNLSTLDNLVLSLQLGS